MARNNYSYEKKKQILLEIGCGKRPRKGYKTCDIRNLPGVDIVCSAHKLPFNDNTVDEIYSRHVVEHFKFKEFLKVLYEWNRVLKSGGSIYIICPEMLWHLKQILEGSHKSFFDKSNGKNDRYWGFGSLFGWQQSKYDIHQFGYYFELLKDILEDFGFTKVKNLTNSGKGLENTPWHLEVQAVKSTPSKPYAKSKFYNHFDVTH